MDAFIRKFHGKMCVVVPQRGPYSPLAQRLTGRRGRDQRRATALLAYRPARKKARAQLASVFTSSNSMAAIGCGFRPPKPRRCRVRDGVPGSPGSEATTVYVAPSARPAGWEGRCAAVYICDIDALWVSETGIPMSMGTLANRIEERTKAAFGQTYRRTGFGTRRPPRSRSITRSMSAMPTSSSATRTWQRRKSSTIRPEPPGLSASSRDARRSPCVSSMISRVSDRHRETPVARRARC